MGRSRAGQRRRGYGRAVDGEPRNAASDLTRLLMPRLSDSEFLDAWPDRSTDGFAMQDRRRLVGLPTVDVYGFMDRLRDLYSLDAGAPEFSVEEVIAVRGKRSAVFRSRTAFPLREIYTDSIMLIRYDRPVWRTELLVQFDDDDVDSAIVELDRLYTEVESGDAPPPSR